MPTNRYQDARRAHLLLSATGGAALFLVADGWRSLSVWLALLVGAAAGVALGLATWKQIASRIDGSNTVTLYFTDAPMYALVVLVGIVSLAPRSLESAFRVVGEHPTLLPIGVAGLVGMWVAFETVMYVAVRRFETRNGALRTRSFYSRSATGPEGMLGREAVVVERCAPRGKVRLGPELWNARSLTSEAIELGTQVTVRDLDGLTLIVEAGR